MSIEKIIMVAICDIDSIVKKEDAVIVYLKNNKYWVCEKVERIENIYKLTLKGKCDR